MEPFQVAGRRGGSYVMDQRSTCPGVPRSASSVPGALSAHSGCPRHRHRARLRRADNSAQPGRGHTPPACAATHAPRTRTHTRARTRAHAPHCRCTAAALLLLARCRDAATPLLHGAAATPLLRSAAAAPLLPRGCGAAAAPPLPHGYGGAAAPPPHGRRAADAPLLLGHYFSSLPAASLISSAPHRSGLLMSGT